MNRRSRTEPRRDGSPLPNTRYFDKLHQVWGDELYLDMSPFHHTRKRLIMQLLAGFSGSKTPMLDVGCGIGDLMFSLSKRGVAADGTDISLFALRVAAGAAPGNLVLCDARWLPFRDNYYRVVVCSEVLEHIENHARAAKEINRVLGPGGVALFTVPHGNKYWTWEDQVDGHLRRYAKNEFVGLVESAGFDVDDIRCWGFPLAALFRSTISTPMFNRGFQRSKSHVKYSPIFRLLLKLILNLFRMDDFFHESQLGIGLVARARKRGSGGSVLVK